MRTRTYVRALDRLVAYPRVDGDESKHGWTTKQAWMRERLRSGGVRKLMSLHLAHRQPDFVVGDIVGRECLDG